MIETAIAKLIIDEDLTSISNRVWIDHVPQWSDDSITHLPFIVVETVEENYSYSCGIVHDDTIISTVQVHCISETKKQCFELSNTIKDILDLITQTEIALTDYTIDIEQILIQSIRPQNEPDILGKDSRIFHRIIELEIYYKLLES